MNSAAVAPVSEKSNADESLAFLAFRGERTPASLSQVAEDALHGVAALVLPLIAQTVSARNAEEFEASEAEVFPKYMAFLTAYGSIVCASLSKRAVKQASYESLLDLEAHFRNCALEAFGQQIKDQAIFAAWTLRQINELVGKVDSEPALAGERRSQERELILRFRFRALQTRFSLDCLLVAMKQNIGLYPDVLALISERLRAIVNAYGHVREGHELRKTLQKPEVVPIEWDEEDELLLRAAG